MKVNLLDVLKWFSSITNNNNRQYILDELRIIHEDIVNKSPMEINSEFMFNYFVNENKSNYDLLSDDDDTISVLSQEQDSI